MPSKQLAKGGKKFVASMAGPSAPVLALESNAARVESVQSSHMAEGRGGIFLRRITAILGAGKDGQFRVETEVTDCDGIPEKELTVISLRKYKMECVVPARFLKNAGKSNAKLIVPDLIKVGAYISVFIARGIHLAAADAVQAAGLQARQLQWFVELDYVLSQEMETAWIGLGLLNTDATYFRYAKRVYEERRAKLEDKSVLEPMVSRIVYCADSSPKGAALSVVNAPL